MDQRGVEAEGRWDVLCHSHSHQPLDAGPMKPHPKGGGRGLRHALDKLGMRQAPEHWWLLFFISKFRNN